MSHGLLHCFAWFWFVVKRAEAFKGEQAVRVSSQPPKSVSCPDVHKLAQLQTSVELYRATR